MSVASLKLTADRLNTFPDDGKRHEIIDGDLIMSPAPERAHQELVTRLSYLFGDYARSRRTFRLFMGPVDVRFTDTDQVQPDVLLIREDRMHVYRGHTVWEAPDIVVEIVSPSSRDYDLVAKRELYERGGVPEYWIVDATNGVLEILTLN